MKKQFLKTIGSTLIVGAFLLLAFGSDSSQSNNDETSSVIIDKSNSYAINKKIYEGNRYSTVYESIGEKSHLQQAVFNKKYKDCAKKEITNNKVTK